MNLQPEGPGFESQTSKIKLATESKLSFKSKNGFNKHCSETNCASQCQVYSLIWKIRLTLLFMNFVVKRKWEEKKGWLSFAARKRSNNGLSKSHVLSLDGVEATSVASVSCSTFFCRHENSILLLVVVLGWPGLVILIFNLREVICDSFLFSSLGK